MKTHLLLFTCLLAASSWQSGQAAPHAASTKPEAALSKEDLSHFTRLSFSSQSGFTGLPEDLVITQDNVNLIYATAGPPGSPPLSERNSRFPNVERRKLITFLQQLNFASFSGPHSQGKLIVAPSESVSIQVGPGQDAKTLKATNYGNQAPRDYYKLTRRLRELKERLFPPSGSSAPVADSALRQSKRNFSYIALGGGPEAFTERLLIRDDKMLSIQTSAVGRPYTVKVAPFSEAEWSQLQNVLDKASFKIVAGIYRDNNMSDGVTEILTTAREPYARKKEAILRYGRLGPEGMSDIMLFLRELQLRKFPRQPSP